MVGDDGSDQSSALGSSGGVTKPSECEITYSSKTLTIVILDVLRTVPTTALGTFDWRVSYVNVKLVYTRLRSTETDYSIS